VVQYIKQANIFGKIGENLGKGLAEQLPKEVERGRLAAGLKNLGEQRGQSPYQQFTGLVAAAHEYPQVVQSGTELLKQQGIRQAYANQANRIQGQGGAGGQPALPPNIAQTYAQIGRQSGTGQPNAAPETVSPYQTGQPQVVGTNPLRPETTTVKPMTPQQKVDDINQLAENFPNLTYPDLKAMSDENEQRRIAQPEAERAEDDRLRGIQDRLRTGFDTLLQKKLQKTPADTFKNLTGEMQNNLIRSMNKDLREHPELSEDDVINKWTQKGLDLAKAKSKLDAKLGSSIFALPILLNRSEYRKGLEDLGDVYRQAGNSEEFFNTLREYGFSPRGAGSLAYKNNSTLQKYVDSSQKSGSMLLGHRGDNARKIALGIENLITPQDSILAIANDLVIRDRLFPLNDFLNQIREDKDEIGLTPRQRRELSEAGHVMPYWSDILVLPQGK
jgi:hypothetical protein